MTMRKIIERDVPLTALVGNILLFKRIDNKSFFCVTIMMMFSSTFWPCIMEPDVSIDMSENSITGAILHQIIFQKKY